MVKVFCFIYSEWPGVGVNAAALCECGTQVGGHTSTNVSWSKADMMGDSFPTKVDGYRKHVAEAHDGADMELVWIDGPESEGWSDLQQAIHRSNARANEETAAMIEQAREGGHD